MNDNSIKNNAIGIFDSGVGGLTVMKEVIKALPNENIVYFGDTARVPYGSKSTQTVINFSTQIVKFLLEKNVKIIVLACNTVSSNAYETLKSQFDIPIIEVVSMGVNSVGESKKVGVIGTESTISSGAYERKLKEKDKNIKVYQKPCPLFVPLVEEGWVKESVTKDICQIYMKDFIEKQVDSIVLGCTHYPLLEKVIQEVVGDIKVINPAKTTADFVKYYLEKSDLLTNNKSNGTYKLYTSDHTEKFDKICSNILCKVTDSKELLKHREQINIEKY